MNSLEILRREMETAESDPDFVYEQLLLDVNERILTAMERAGVRKADLAERLGTSRAYITKLLGGPENLTLKTLVRVAMALNSRVELRIRGIAPDAHADRSKLIRSKIEANRGMIEAKRRQHKDRMSALDALDALDVERGLASPAGDTRMPDPVRAVPRRRRGAQQKSG